MGAKVPTTQNPAQLGPWVKGLINAVDRHSIPADGLAVADNVNIDRDGVVTSRSKYDLIDSANYSSIHSHNGVTYAVRDSVIGVLSDASFTQLATVSGPVDYTTLNGELVYTDYESCKRVNTTGVYDLPVGSFGSDEELEYQYKPLVGGSFVEYFRGRLLVGRGSTLYWSEAIHYGVYSATRNFIKFDEKIQWLVALETCVYVGLRNSVVYLSGTDPASFTIVRVAGKSAPGAATRFNNIFTGDKGAPVALWYTDVGIAVGDQQGSVVYPQADRLKGMPLHSGKMVVENDRVYIFTTKES